MTTRRGFLAAMGALVASAVLPSTAKEQAPAATIDGTPIFTAKYPGAFRSNTTIRLGVSDAIKWSHALEHSKPVAIESDGLVPGATYDLIWDGDKFVAKHVGWQ